ncbi:MAG: hypothetical protein OZSIB_3495 [Candidatus Ozemobacter sibiricus]|jgi:hypothetical protein|uniref:Transglycosylase SLT domain-containing protein n=1 Tax=Candidatus Ozemobacter sibiricus TaxID=2268124 RepID=A0A367ZQC1_9BACT|nr:MAG: hypothetical protein OZSIB_3495 [Candidatus Ozemobacter sibiricus]
MRIILVGILTVVALVLLNPGEVAGGSPFIDDQLTPGQRGTRQDGELFEPVPPDEPPDQDEGESDATKPPANDPPPSPGKKGVTAGSKDFPEWFDKALSKAADWNFPVIRNKYGELITVTDFFKAIIWIESNGVHKLSNGVLLRSCVGAMGFAQLMPATARSLGVNPQDPADNLKGGILLLNQIFQVPAVKEATGEEKLIKAVVAYNAGMYSKLLKKPWDQLKMGKAREPIGYGLKLKMCLGLQLTDTEKQLVSKMFGVRLANVDAFAAREFYATSHGLR